MAEINVSAPERLRLLLPWMNGDTDDPGDALSDFVGLYQVAGQATEILSYDGRGKLTQQQLDNLRAELLRRLEAADSESNLDPWRSFGSLRGALTRQRDKPDKLSAESVDRAKIEAPGAHTLSVHGPFRDVVIYAFMRTLTEPGTVYLSRCPAIAPHEETRPCGRLFISHGHRGRPAEYCSDRCRVRAWQKRR